MKIYTGPVSPNSKKVRIVANEVGVPLEPVLMDFAKGDFRKPEYVALNPVAKVPTVQDDDFALWESAAILCYLARKTGSDALFPRDPRAEADTLRWMFYGACHVDPYVTTLVVERFIKPRMMGTAPDDAQVNAAEASLRRFVPVIDAQVGAHEYLTGRFSIADVAVGCTLEACAVGSFGLTEYRNVTAWLARLEARPSWRDASPTAL